MVSSETRDPVDVIRAALLAHSTKAKAEQSPSPFQSPALQALAALEAERQALAEDAHSLVVAILEGEIAQPKFAALAYFAHMRDHFAKAAGRRMGQHAARREARGS